MQNQHSVLGAQTLCQKVEGTVPKPMKDRTLERKIGQSHLFLNLEAPCRSVVVILVAETNKPHNFECAWPKSSDLDQYSWKVCLLKSPPASSCCLLHSTPLQQENGRLVFALELSLLLQMGVLH